MRPFSNMDSSGDGRAAWQNDRVRQIRVLLVDDDPVDAKYVQLLSRDMQSFQAGFVVAHNPDMVADLLEEQPFDLALVDFWLGTMPAIPIIQALSARHAIPTVVLTGLDVTDIRETGFEAGALGFLSKHHLSTQALESVVASVLRLHDVEREQEKRLESFGGHGLMMKPMTDWLASVHARLHNLERALTPVGGGQGTFSQAANEIAFLRREIASGLLLLDPAGPGPLEIVRFDFAAVAAGALHDLVGADEVPPLAFEEPLAPVWVESDRVVVSDLVAYLVKAAHDECRQAMSLRVGTEGDNAVLVLAPKRAGASEGGAWLASRAAGTPVDPGFGIGRPRLNLAAKTAERLGGLLRIGGAPGAGTTVLSLPIRALQRRPSDPSRPGVN